jgi:hypothetical protein
VRWSDEGDGMVLHSTEQEGHGVAEVALQGMSQGRT